MTPNNGGDEGGRHEGADMNTNSAIFFFMRPCNAAHERSNHKQLNTQLTLETERWKKEEEMERKKDRKKKHIPILFEHDCFFFFRVVFHSIQLVDSNNTVCLPY